MPEKYVFRFEELNHKDVDKVGGKNASLGEMVQALKKEKIRVPDGFATTATAYWAFIKANGLKEKIEEKINELHKGRPVDKVGKAIRNLFLKSEFPVKIADSIRNGYSDLCRRYNVEEVDVAVRSSATAEDLPDASFAGQQETFLNLTGEHDVLEACRKCYASLFTDRAITYREEKGFDHMKVALSVGVQKMVRSDKSGSGVMFSLDTETGFPNLVLINASWGLGENVVKGIVTPDEYRVFKPLIGKTGCVPIIEKSLGDKEKKMIYAQGDSRSTRNIDTPKKERRRFVLSDEEILILASWACDIERHYKKAMDMEWAKDGDTDELFIVQARPETVHSTKGKSELKQYRLNEKGKIKAEGLSIGDAIASGKASVIKSTDDLNKFKEGKILVTEMTDPDWVTIMKKAAGIITDAGGRTCHAAIVSRELGIPAIVGTGDATDILQDEDEITMSCAEGEKGFVYEGILDYEVMDVNLEGIPETRTRIMMNMASPGAAFRWWRLPCKGIGLARMEFIINNIIKIHPMALIRYDDLEDKDAKKKISELTRDYENKAMYFIDHLSRGIAKIAASVYPYPTIVRMSDFKTNEYADLIGGRGFEPAENNPMLGFRGASRYTSDLYREGFALECRAIRQVRETIGLKNVVVMIPFCRTLEEADLVLAEMASHDLIRGKEDLEIYVMCEIPSNVILADEFSQRFDGFSIGSNDLTQLILGVDRDASTLSHLFDERNEAVKRAIVQLIQSAHKNNRKVGICGQAPSDYPDFAIFLVKSGIDSMSLSPDSVIDIIRQIAEVE
jgi:pyruvate, water dikinase